MAANRPDESSRVPTPQGVTPETWLETAVARDPVLSPFFPRLRQLATSDAPVLIVGEEGTGCELAARAIHDLSARAAHPFVAIDCASLCEPLIEAELLGVGGGIPVKPGIFEQAGQGSVLLAEVGELPPRLQATLVHLLDDQHVLRLGAERALVTRARCLATTSVDLRSRIPAGLFREDLHARFAAGEIIELTPLRERADDIPVLARHVLEQCCGHLPNGARELTPEVENLLRAYSWPGNLRELREVIEDGMVRAQGHRLSVEHLPERLRGEAPAGPLRSLREVETQHIERVLEQTRGNQRRASRILGISRWSLSRRLRKYALQPRGQSAAGSAPLHVHRFPG